MTLEEQIAALISAIGADWIAMSAAIDQMAAIANAGGVHAREATVATGSYLSCALNATALTTAALAANRLDFIPFQPARDLAINEIAIEVTTAVAASAAQIGIYSTSNIERPVNLLVASANLDCSTLGAKTAAIAITLEAGTKYWLAINSNSNPTIRMLSGAALMPVEAPTFGATSTPTIRRVAGVNFAAGLPAVAPATAATSASAAYIRLRLA
jgi:hypothetical protein